MSSQDEHEVVNDYQYQRRDAEEIEIRLELWHRLARQVWAIIIILAQLDTGAKPDWRKH